VGCEFDEDFVISSRQNCARSRYGNKVRIEYCDATIFKIPLESNVIFFFNSSFNDALKSSCVFSVRDQ
jgi:hypothetical protein